MLINKVIKDKNIEKLSNENLDILMTQINRTISMKIKNIRVIQIFLKVSNLLLHFP